MKDIVDRIETTPWISEINSYGVLVGQPTITVASPYAESATVVFVFDVKDRVTGVVHYRVTKTWTISHRGIIDVRIDWLWRSSGYRMAQPEVNFAFNKDYGWGPISATRHLGTECQGVGEPASPNQGSIQKGASEAGDHNFSHVEQYSLFRASGGTRVAVAINPALACRFENPGGVFGLTCTKWPGADTIEPNPLTVPHPYGEFSNYPSDGNLNRSLTLRWWGWTVGWNPAINSPNPAVMYEDLVPMSAGETWSDTFRITLTETPN